MKKFLLSLMIVALLSPAVSASAAKKASYTLSQKGSTVLQNGPDRAIDCQTETAARAPVSGESPVTGLPWEGTYLPVLVQIGNYTGTAQVNGRKIQASGIGKNSPWGIQHADVLYEELMSMVGNTRFTALFSDSFAQGQPADGVGPVRSCRIGALYLREEWQSGLVYSGGFGGLFGWRDTASSQFLKENGLQEKGVLLNTLTDRVRALWYRVKGIKAPNNLNIDLIAARGLIPASYTAETHPFLFTDESPYGEEYVSAGTVNLDWGYKYNISHFIYDTEINAYRRYCGAGTNALKWVPFTAIASAVERSEEARVPITFANVIVQRVEYKDVEGVAFRMDIQSVGSGNADIFVNGRYIPGYWVRVSLHSPTVFYDDQGREMELNRGKTFIAHFPAESLCTFTAQDQSV